MKALRLLVVALCLSTAIGCSVSKHAQTSTTSIGQTSSGSSTQSSLLVIDSLIRHLSLDADSICVSLPMPAGTASSHLDSASSLDESLAPAIRITAHRPHIESNEQRCSNTRSTTTANDSTRSIEQTQSTATTDTDTVGVAKPMNGTAVTIVIVIGVLLLLIGAVVLLLWLHKKGII